MANGDGGRPATAAGTPVLEVRDLVKHFPLTRGVLFHKQIGAVKAVDGVSFDLHQGRPSASSANRAAASPPSPSCWSASNVRRPVRSVTGARTSAPSPPAR